MSKKSKLKQKKVEAPAAQAPAQPAPDLQQVFQNSQQERILQLTAQANASKQMVDELVQANIGLRSQSMLMEHHLTIANNTIATIQPENAALKTEVEALKKQVEKFEKQTKEAEAQADMIEESEDDEDDQEAAA